MKLATRNHDNWSSEAYQHSASFVPKLAGKIVQWLDVEPDDKILDVGCGDGVLSVMIGQMLSEGAGTGSIHGIDRSPAMVEAARARAGRLANCTFEVVDATEIPTAAAHLQRAAFTKVFSNAALHWILQPASGAAVFGALREALVPAGRLIFEMGGLGNVGEMRAALLAAVARRVGIDLARAADPWFFPDEAWVRRVLEGGNEGEDEGEGEGEGEGEKREGGGVGGKEEKGGVAGKEKKEKKKGGGWVVERVETEWRPTVADKGGVEGWVRLMGASFFSVVPEREREACVRDVVDVLETVCPTPGAGGGYTIGYVRLRCVARKVAVEGE